MRGEIFTQNQIDKQKNSGCGGGERKASKEGRKDKRRRREGGRKKGIIWELKT